MPQSEFICGIVSRADYTNLGYPGNHKRTVQISTNLSWRFNVPCCLTARILLHCTLPVDQLYLSTLLTMLATRRLTTVFPYARQFAARFHSTPPGYVKVGDVLPDLEVLAENSAGNKVNLAKELKKGKGVIV